MRSLFLVSVILLAVSAVALCDYEPIPEDITRGLSAEQTEHVRKSAREKAHSIGDHISSEGMHALAVHTDNAISMLVGVGVRKLMDAGDPDARKWELDYRRFSGFLTKMVDSRDIGDHKPLIQWLADFYDHLEFVLGVSLCNATHLSAIKIFNFSIPVAFKPCTFPMDSVPGEREDEYRRHFAEGAIYWGLLPEVTYWVIEGPCFAAAGGVICMPLAMGGEYVMGKFIAPKLSDWVFERTCK